jgi:hypothetical protein
VLSGYGGLPGAGGLLSDRSVALGWSGEPPLAAGDPDGTAVGVFEDGEDGVFRAVVMAAQAVDVAQML